LETTRRSFLAQSAGALGILFLDSLTPQLFAQAHEHARAAATSGSQSFQFLTKQEAADFEAFSAQIIPTDETPGAREAGAVYFADYVLSTINPEQQQDFRNALALLRVASAEAQPGAASFSVLLVDKQIAVMKAMEKGAEGNALVADPTESEAAKRAEAFGLLRATGLVGTFSDPSLHGNRDQIGWKLIGFNDQAYWAPPFGYYDAHAEDKA
jgi:gluconate 2-dehydrogenase gamma chain